MIYIRGATRPTAAAENPRPARRLAMTRTEPLQAGPSAAFEPDRVVRLVAHDGYHVHRLIYATLATRGVRDFLFAPFAVDGDVYAVLVRPLGVETHFAEGQRFHLTLRAMPAVKHGGKRRSIGASRSKDSLRLRWIRSRADESGFRLLADPRMRVERIRLEDAKIPFGFNSCLYQAPIRITDPAPFTRAYTRGVGQGRAWGCGMMILREA